MDWTAIRRILTEVLDPEVRDSGLTKESCHTDIAKCCGLDFGSHVTWHGAWIPCDYDRAKRWLKKLRREEILRHKHEKIAKAGKYKYSLNNIALYRVFEGGSCQMIGTVIEHKPTWSSDLRKPDSFIRSIVNAKAAILRRRPKGSLPYLVEPCNQLPTSLTDENGGMRTHLDTVFHVRKNWGRSAWSPVQRQFKTEEAAVVYIGKWIDGKVDVNLEANDPRIKARKANQEVK